MQLLFEFVVMDFCWLFWLALILFVITVVGHGLWLLGRAMVRGVTGPIEPSAGPRARCARCRTFFPSDWRECPGCGLSVRSPVAGELADLEASARSLESLSKRAMIDADTAERLYQAIEKRQHELIVRFTPLKTFPGLPNPPEVMPAPPVRAAEAKVEHEEIEEKILPVVAEPSEPPIPRRSWSQLLGEFMVERNILWGELIGGLLIVGCSIALVISLWRTLEAQVPYLPFLVMAALTSALFGAGRYTLSHWRLEATSRGFLVIATLLTPLNFVVLAGLTRGRPAEPMDIAIELLALAWFTGLVRGSSHVFMPGMKRLAWLTAIAVVGASGSQLLVPRWLELAEPTPWLFAMLSLVPVGLQLVAIAPLLLDLLRRATFTTSDANRLLLVVAQTVFATSVALGFIVYWSNDPFRNLSHLAIPLAMHALALLAVASLIHVRLDTDIHDEDHHGLSPKTTLLLGTLVGVIGAMLLLVALGLAWPRPLPVVIIGLINAAVFAALALMTRIPHAHIPGAICFAIATTTLFHWSRGNFVAGGTSLELARLAVSPTGALGLTLAAAFLALFGEVLARIGRGMDAIIQQGVAGAVAILALICVLPEPNEALRGAAVYFVAGMGGFWVNCRWRMAPLTQSPAFVLVGFAYFITRHTMPQFNAERHWALALVGHATMTAAASLMAYRIARRPQLSWVVSSFATPLLDTALIVSFASLLPIFAAIDWDTLPFCFASCMVLAILWSIIAWAQGWPVLFACSQAAVALAVVLGTTQLLRDQEWVQWNPQGLVHVWSIQFYGVGLAATCLFWSMVRLCARRLPRSKALLEADWFAFDQVMALFLVCAHTILATINIVPDVVCEISSGFVPRGSALALPTAWLATGMLVAALGLNFAVTRSRYFALGMLVLIVSVPILFALGFSRDRAAATALRWGLAVTYLACSIAIWINGRRQRQAAHYARNLLLILTVGPVLVLSCWLGARYWSGWSVPGPMVGTIWSQFDIVTSWAVPLGILVASLTGHGIRAGLPGYLFGAGYVLMLVVTGSNGIQVVQAGRAIDMGEGIRLAQIALVTGACWVIAWLKATRWRSMPHLLAFVGQLSTCAILLLVGALFALTTRPWPAFLPDFGRLLGWCSWLSVATATTWSVSLISRRMVVHVVAVAGIGCSVLAAVDVASWDATGWVSYHVLTLSLVALGFGIVVVSWTGSAASALGPGTWSPWRRARAAKLLRLWFPGSTSRRWVESLSLTVAAMAVAGAWSDPGRPYWSSGATLSVAVLLGAVAVWARRPGYVVASGLLLNLVAYLFWQAELVGRFGLHQWYAWGVGVTDRFILLQVMALSIGSSIWSWVESILRNREPPIDLRGRSMPYVFASSLIATHILAALTLTGLTSDLLNLQVHLDDALLWPAFAVTLIALALILRDPEAGAWGMPALPIYFLSYMTVGLALHQLAFAPRDLIRAGMLSSAGFVLFAFLVVRILASVNLVKKWLGIVRLNEDRTAGWFLPTQAVTGSFALALSAWVCFGDALMMDRFAAPVAVIVLIVSCIAGRWIWPNVLHFQLLILALVVVACGEASWAQIGTDGPVPWLHRSARLLLVSSAFLALYGWPRPLGRWQEAARIVAVQLGQLTVFILITFFVQQFLLYDPIARRTGLGWTETAMVAALLMAATVAAMSLAFQDATHFDLRRRGRLLCVWGAEILFVLFLIHLRLNVPDVFPSFLGRFWPFTIMAVSFIGVSASETLRRRNAPIVATPILQTGLLLPLLPLLAYLIRPLANFGGLAEAIPGLQPMLRYLDHLPSHFGTHASVWFLCGLLYALVAVLQWSSGFALIGALAINFGLWVLYANSESLSFMRHPQLWLIPIGLIMLAAEFLNRARLGQHAPVVRYLGLLLVYVASTADMFITGLGNSVLLPILLAMLSVAGVLAGIMLRIRGFLFLGTAFLGLVIFAQIWHAAVDRQQTWLWWASGIVLGIAILSLFAIFEKRRHDVMRILADVRQWQ